MAFNLDEVLAEQAAAGAEPFVFVFGGEDYELPARADLLAFGRYAQNPISGMRQLLGPEQWKRVLASDAVLTDDGAEALLLAWFKHSTGTEPDEELGKEPID